MKLFRPPQHITCLLASDTQLMASSLTDIAMHNVSILFVWRDAADLPPSRAHLPEVLFFTVESCIFTAHYYHVGR